VRPRSRKGRVKHLTMVKRARKKKKRNGKKKPVVNLRKEIISLTGGGYGARSALKERLWCLPTAFSGGGCPQYPGGETCVVFILYQYEE